MTDDSCDLDNQSLPQNDFRERNPFVEGVAESSVLGIAIFNSQFRYVTVNNALAAMNGVPVEAHIGKTAREVIGRVASTVEPILRSVLLTGQSVLNVEIMGELPSRSTEGHWIANYIPIHNSFGEVKQVGVLVIEITRFRKVEKCISTLMGNLPCEGRQDPSRGMGYGIEKESVELWRRSIELVENCAREMVKDSDWFRPPALKPKMGDLGTRPRGPSRSDSFAIPNDLSNPVNDSNPARSNGVKRLSPREIEVVQFLARGKNNKEISTALSIAVKTVETYRAMVMLKLRAHSVTDLVRYAVRLGLIKA